MNPQHVVEQAKTKFTTAVAHLQEELKKLRTGRAHTGMLDGLMVEAYGTSMPLNQVANVSTPEAQLLQITPFDPSTISAITSAIRDNQVLGLNPMDDGRVVRVAIPTLTEERRRDLTKQINTKLEDCMISLRATRHEALDAISKSSKAKEIGEDEAKRLGTQVDEALQSSKQSAETFAKTKEREIMTV